MTEDPQPEAQPESTRPPDVGWQPLGELLVSRGVLTREQLELALAEQRQSGRRLGEILVGNRAVSARDLSRALADQFGLDLGGGEEADAGPAVPRSEAGGGPAGRTSSDSTLLLFVPSSVGYRLVELDRAGVAAGGEIDVDGERFTVAKVAPSPFPGDSRRCAYLLPLP